jgi:hypothetical protein
MRVRGMRLAGWSIAADLVPQSTTQQDPSVENLSAGDRS